MPKIHWFQLLKSEDVKVFVAFYNDKLNIFEFWTVGQTKLNLSIDFLEMINQFISKIFYRSVDNVHKNP